VEQGIPCPILAGVDNKNRTYGAFIEDYLAKWRPFEVEHGQEWCVDKGVKGHLPDGTERYISRIQELHGSTFENPCTSSLSTNC
jgi:hypothetical protein